MFHWIALIAAIVLVVAVAGAVVSSQQSLEPSQQQTSEKNQREKHNEKNKKTLWDRWFPDSISVFTLFLVVFTAVLAFVGITQLNFLNRAERIAENTAQAAKNSADAAKQSAEIAERALIAGQRAFISVAFQQNANRNIETGNVTAWIFKPIWTNAGDTPTRNMTNHINIHIFDGVIPNDWDFPDLWNVSIPAGERTSIPMGIAPKSWIEGQSVSATVETMDEIVTGNKQLLMWGWAKYSDVFPNTNQHVTRFAVRIVAGGNPRDPQRMSFSYPYLARYNCSDEECEHQGFPAGWTPRDSSTE